MEPPVPRITYEPLRSVGASDVYGQATLGDTLGAVAEEAFITNPTTSLLNIVRRDSEDSPILTPEDANKKYSVGNLIFDDPISEARAEYLFNVKRAEMIRNNIISRGPQGFGAGAAKFGTALAVSALDPINVASSFIPSIALTRGAAAMKMAAPAFMTKRAGQTVAQRALYGAAEGAVGAAIVEPLVLLSAQKDRRDYDLADSMANIAFGGILGGGLHSLGRYMELRGEKAEARKKSELSERIDRLEIEERRELLRGAFAESSVDQMPKNADAILQRMVIANAQRRGLTDLTFRADGTLSSENQVRLEKRSQGEPVAAVPVARFDSRAKADKFIRGHENRSDFITSFDEASGGYVVSNIRKSSIVKNEIGQVRKFKSHKEAKEFAEKIGDAQAVSLVKTAGKADQNFVVIRGITPEEAKTIGRDASYLEFYEPQTKRASVKSDPQRFIAENGITLKQPEFNPNNLDNDLFIDPADSADPMPDLPDTVDAKKALEQGDDLIGALREQKDFLTEEQLSILDATDNIVKEAEDESRGLKLLGYCLLRT